MVADDVDREQVRQAALWLDEEVPGWWARIDPITLDLSHHKHCVCGQLGQSWAASSNVLAARIGVDPDDVSAFCDPDNEPAWLEEIAERMPAPDREVVEA